MAMTLGRLANLLGRKGVQVDVFAPFRRERETSPEDRFHLHHVPGFPIPKYRELCFGWPAFQKLRAEWQRNPPSIVHVATEGPLGWSAARVAKELEIPVISSFHTNFHNYSQHYGIGLLNTALLSWLRSFHNKTLRTFAPSTDLIADLQKEGFKNLRLLARGVDTHAFSPEHRSEPLRAEWGADEDTPVLLYTGRIAEEKNLPLVIKAHRNILATLPHAKLVFVGDGPMLTSIKNMLPEAIFTGMKTGRALATAYASADAFLFASTTETFGNVVTEAMASALPVLAYDYAAPHRLIEHGTSGLLAPFNDERAFLALADWLANNRHAWKKMGSAARKSVLPLSWDSIVDSYLQDISTLLHPQQ